MWSLILFGLGMLYTNFLEWSIHKYILHGLGKNKNSRFHFHMVHHMAVSKEDYSDPTKGIEEEVALFFTGLLHLPLLWISVYFYLGAFFGGILYYGLHWVGHKFPPIGRSVFTSHYNHHTYYPNKNWCVTYPLFDLILGSYKKHKG